MQSVIVWIKPIKYTKLKTMRHLTYKQRTKILATVAILSFLTGCSSPINEIEQPSDTTPRMVGITTRATADIDYPVTLYAFNSNTGVLADKVTAESEGKALTMSLKAGNYHLVALAGAQGLETTDSPTSDSSIGIPSNGLITSAVQMGGADIEVYNTDLTVELNMSYQVARINIELRDIPTDVKDVSVSLSSLSADETFSGTLSGSQTVKIPLSKEGDGVWKSTTCYTLPGLSTQLTLSISMTTNSGETSTWGYIHPSNLTAGTPYTLAGSYKEGFNITGTIASKGWNAAQSINFTFGPVSDTNGSSGIKDDDIPDDKSGNYWVTEMPEAISIWNGHFVGAVTTSSDTEATVLLMSLEEWETTAANATTAWSGYSEGNIESWRIPTATEMTTIASWGKTENRNTLDKANGELTNEGGGTKLTNGAYYLCNDGAKIVKFSETKASDAASDVTYRLRLVKSITVKIPQE